jgi:hypothetical protein
MSRNCSGERISGDKGVVGVWGLGVGDMKGFLFLVSCFLFLVSRLKGLGF